LVFAELQTGRRREVMSAVAHYIAGVLPWKQWRKLSSLFAKPRVSTPATA
jgi:hypothetical protein